MTTNPTPPLQCAPTARAVRPPRAERPQRSLVPRSVKRRSVDAADAALIAHWPRLARPDDGLDLLAIDDETGADDAIATSGWFDSTWELRQGLEISEVQPAELPLDGWLAFYLST